MAASLKCVSNNKNRLEKKMEPVQEFDNEVQIHSFETIEEEYQSIVDSIGGFLPEDKVAVLLRTNNLAEYAAEQFYKRKLPYVIKEKRILFYDIAQVQDITAVLRFVFCGRRRGDFLRFMNKPYRGILRENVKDEVICFEKIKQEYRNNEEIYASLVKLEKQCDLLAGMDPYSGIFYILNGMGYKDYMMKNVHGNEEQKKYLITIMEELLRRAKEFSTVEKFLGFIREYKEEFDNIGNDSSQPSTEQIRIMTYHASKGLEFDRVFLPQVNKGLVPHGNMLTSDELEEERRMFYVAMTRAKCGLYITCVKEANGSEESVFIKELAEE